MGQPVLFSCWCWHVEREVSAVSPCFHGLLAFLHRHFPPRSPPSHPLGLSLHSQQQPSHWDWSTIPKHQLPAAAPSRKSAFLPGICMVVFSSVQFTRSVVSYSLRPHELQHARPPCPSSTPGVHSDSSPSSRWCHPAISSSAIPFSSSPQSLPASVFSNEPTLRMRWPKYWSFSFSIIPSKEIPGLISFRMDWLDLLAVHGTLKSLLQHHSSKASILWCSAFFTVQLSYPYMTTGKTIALTR